MTPRIGESVERLVDGQWVVDWLRQVLTPERCCVPMWGMKRELYDPSHVWRPRILTERPPQTHYTNPQSEWLKKTWPYRTHTTNYVIG